MSLARLLLVPVLEEARALLDRPDNAFLYSPWSDRVEALQNMGALIGDVQTGRVPDQDTIRVLFAPTGPLQEVAESSGWSNEFLTLANRFDRIEPFVWLFSRAEVIR